MEIPRAPVRIIDHVIIGRRCGYCGKVHVPKLGISDGVVGKMRLGVELMSLITTLSVAKRMPQRRSTALALADHSSHSLCFRGIEEAD